MADTDKLSLGLDDIIRTDRSSNRRGGKQGFRGRAGARPTRGGGQTNGFRTRGGGGLVIERLFFMHCIYIRILFSLEHPMHQQDVGNMICSKIIQIAVALDNVVVV